MARPRAAITKFRGLHVLFACLITGQIIQATSLPAFALSEIKPAPSPSAEDVTEPEQTPADDMGAAPASPRSLPALEGPQVGPDGGLPEPGPMIRRPEAAGGVTLSEPDQPSPEIMRDLGQLPAPTARMRELIVQAARSGDPERLRALLGTGPSATQLSLSGLEEDPVAYLKSISGDGEGMELLAIMLDVFDAGFVHLDQGGANDLYVWPYFVATDLDKLTPEQTVEILRIVTAGDLEDMRNFGAYNFFRIGISPEGEWRFFISGD